MDLLEKNWIPFHRKYPVYLLTQEKYWSREDKIAIKRKWNTFDLHFMSIHDQFWNYPKNITFEDSKKPLSNIEYKNMIAFMTYGFTRIPELTQYHYLMRLDDDACLLDAINYDMFAEMKYRRANYGFHDMFMDPSHVVEGISEFMENYANQSLYNQHSKTSSHLRPKLSKWANPELHNWRVSLNMTISPAFADNFEIINIRRYLQPDITHFLRHIEDSHMIYHRRWGDSPIRYYMAELFWGSSEVLLFCDFDFQHSIWPLSIMCDHRFHNNSVIKYWNWVWGPESKE